MAAFVQKVAGRSRVRGYALPSDDWKMPSVKSAEKGTFFKAGKDKAAK